jgi:hypothetical protein
MPAGLEFVSGSRGQHWTAVAIELAGKDKPMLRHALVALAAITLLSATLIPDDAFARGGRGGGGGVRGGGAAGVRGGAVGVRGGAVGVRGGGYRTAGVRGGRYGGYYGGARLGVGAAAVGAAAVGAGYYGNYYYNNSCYRDAYGRQICPNQGYGY